MLRQLVAVCVLAVVGAGALSACGGGDRTPAAGVASASPSPSPPACPDTSRCYGFAQDTERWPAVNDDAHYANHDRYLDGSYRVGAREGGTFVLEAPVAVSTLAEDLDVRLDVDATMGQAFPETGSWGAACWTRALEGGRYAGFGVFVQPAEVDLGIFDQRTGEFRSIAHSDADGLVKATGVNHLRLTCRQGQKSGAPTAEVAVDLNGDKVMSVSYGSSPEDRLGWRAADGVGLLAAGKDADVFFDNVEISGKP